MSNRSNRILFVINDLGPGGAERQLIELIKGVSTQYECYLVILDDRKLHYLEEATHYCNDVTVFKRKFRLDPSPVLSLIHYCRANKINFIQSFLPLASFYAALVSRLNGIPFICCAIRDAKDNNWKKKWLIRFVYQLSTIMVSNSKAGLVNRFSSITPKMRVVYNGLDLQRFSSIEKKHIAFIKPINIAMAASFSSHKDHETLIKAFAQLCPEHDIYLFLYGEGSTQATIKLLVAQANISDKVFFMGFCQNILEELATADIAVLTSNTDIHEEGISNSIIEAMAIGLPVIATQGGGTNEIIQDPENGYLVENKNVEQLFVKLKKLIENQELRKDIGKAGKQLVLKRFTYQKFISDYIDIYQNIY